MKRFLSLLITVVFLLGMFPAATANSQTFSFFAADMEVHTSLSNPTTTISFELHVHSNSVFNDVTKLWDCPSLDIVGTPTATYGTVNANLGFSSNCDSSGLEMYFDATYTAFNTYLGADSFTFTVTDGTTTDEGLVTITANTPPTALDGTAAIYGWPSNRDFSIPIVPDPDGDSLFIFPEIYQNDFTYGIITVYGVDCHNPEATCIATFRWQLPAEPEGGFPGEAYIQFQYKLTDGLDLSNLGNVTLLIGDIPQAYNLTSLAANNIDTTLILEGNDGISTDITFRIIDPPSHGDIIAGPTPLASCPEGEPEPPPRAIEKPNFVQSGFNMLSFYKPEVENDEAIIEVGISACASVIYRGDTDYVGEDSFTYVVNDGELDSVPAKVCLFVQELIAPTADNVIAPVTSPVTLVEPISIMLTASDPNIASYFDYYEGTKYVTEYLTIELESGPIYGELSTINEFNCYVSAVGQFCQSSVQYTAPEGDFSGDSFTFHVNDGTFDSNPATVTIIPRSEPTSLNVNTNDDAVDSVCDQVHCSLREAIETSIPGDTVDFTLSRSNTITLTKGMIMVDNDLTISGPGANLLSISGSEATGVFSFYGGFNYVSYSDKPITVTVSGLSIIDGHSFMGGGVINGPDSTLILEDCVIGPNNVATSSGGGGLYNYQGDVTLNRCTITGNQHTIYDGGAGLYVRWGNLTLINSTVTNNVTNNYGGGIFVSGSNINLIHTTVTGNTANEDYQDNLWGGTGGIYIDPYEVGQVTLQNSIVAGNSDLSGLADPADYDYHVAWPDVFGTFTSLGGNLIGDSTGSSGWVSSDQAGNPTTPIDPLLGPLTLNTPGSTPTMALLEGSPAIDSVECLTEVTEDQRGITRPTGSACDIGAFEFAVLEPNQAPVAPDYYAAYGTWPSTTPYDSQFAVPVMDPEGDPLTISYLEETDPASEGVVADAKFYYCDSMGKCWVTFYILPPTSIPPSGPMHIHFQYRINDGTSDSNTANVTLSFGSPIPYAYERHELAVKNETTTIRLDGSGSSVLTFVIVRNPVHGNVGVPTGVTCQPYEGDRVGGYTCNAAVDYTPEIDFEGEDSFAFVVFDGSAYSQQQEVRLLVISNNPPTAAGSSPTVSATQPSTITLEATDPDWFADYPDFPVFHSNLTFVIDTSSLVNGILGAPGFPVCDRVLVGGSNYDWHCHSTVLYTPNSGTTATTDSFSFHVNDVYMDSNIANVSLTLHQPTTLHVNAADDVNDGACNLTHCSLREAVNAAFDGDTIDFTLSLPNTIKLSGSEILINKGITIRGPGADQLAISGGAELEDAAPWTHDRVFSIGTWEEAPVTVSIFGLTIRDGRASDGGGIKVNNGNTLYMEECVIGPNNIVTYAGGGIVNCGGDVTLNRCTVTENEGTGSLGGAGVTTANKGTTTLINSTVSGNITNNFGGGVYVYDSQVRLIHTTVSGNISNENYLDPGEARGGGAGIYMDYLGQVELQNSIVAGNNDMTDPATAGHAKWPDVYGVVTSLGGNLIGDPTGSAGWLSSDLVGTAEEPVDPLLGTLLKNDPGDTLTMALLSGSPAIDAVACVGSVTTDQRGVLRPNGLLCDVGSFEKGNNYIIFMPIIFK